MNDMALEYAQHRFNVDEYHRMDEAGVFAPEAHIELIDGQLVERLVSMKPPHASVVEGLYNLLHTAVAARALVRCQLPITLGKFSEPEPDFALVAGSRSLYKTRHPYADDILAIIEVADTSRDFDVRPKSAHLRGNSKFKETWGRRSGRFMRSHIS